jgi:hypothetical protein
MSTSHQTTDRSTANFTAIFDAAANEYKTLTKQDLGTHPFAAAFENSTSPDSVLDVFRTQAQAFNKFRKGDDKLMAWLTPIVQILFTFSGTLDGIGLVSPRSFQDILSFMSTFLAILARKDSLYWHRCPSRGQSFPHSLMCTHLLFISGGERCYRELRSACEPLRAHSIIPSTSQSLHSGHTHTRYDRVACEDYGPDSLYSGAFDQDNEGEADQ